MIKPIRRRDFMKIAAATAALGATRLSWGQQPAGAPQRPAAPKGYALNDYLVAEISMSALKANLELVRRQLKPTTKLCTVIKADCYGHGWLQCKDAIVAATDWLAVATPEEAIRVRQSGCRLPVLQLMASGLAGDVARERLRQLISEDITLTLAAADDLPVIAAAAAAAGRPAGVHIKIDTGLTRSGVLADKAPELIRQARRQSGVALTGLYTHFALADAVDRTPTLEQLARFHSAVRAGGADAEGLMLHTANSAATFAFPEAHLDMVRVGLAAYGHQPLDDPQKRFPLRPLLRLVTRLTQVKDVPAGSRVSYGWTYKFERPARIGLVPVGYADGYNRCFSNRAVMRIGERTVPIRGRVCMDQTVLELTDVPEAKVGDEVEVIGRDAEAPNSVENLARLAGTILQEITCRLGGRIRRVQTA
jgi:alanine racemase